MAADFYPSTFVSQNWVVYPITWASEQKWVMILTGIAVFDFTGTGQNWYPGTLRLDLGDMVQNVINVSGRKPSPGKFLVFQAEQWANFATINSIFDEHTAVDAGFAADEVSPRLSTLQGVNNIFSGMDVTLDVRDVDAHLYRVGFQATVVGKIVEVSPLP